MNKHDKIYFLKTHLKKTEKFGLIFDVKTNGNHLLTIDAFGNRAIGITAKHEIMEWKNEKTGNRRKGQDRDLLLTKPSFLLHKIKFRKVLVNTSMTLGLDINGDIYVWGNHQDGLLGLGYNITDVDNPTRLESLKNISETSMSETHALAIDNNGTVFAWGQGKYGELCLEKTIYSPFPTKMITSKLYKKAFCGELLTCLIDLNNRFSYFGVIIKVFKKSNYKITFKNLWKDEANLDPNYIFKEKIITELEMEHFTDVMIGNGFIGILSEKGNMYSLDYSDNITLLYSKYQVYSIAISNNQLFSFCKDKNNPNSLYFCRWEPSAEKQSNDVAETWTTHLYSVQEDFSKENDIFLNSNKNNDFLIIVQYNSFPGRNENLLGRSEIIWKAFDKSVDISSSKFSDSWERSTLNGLEGLSNTNILSYLNTFDDSYNRKYKRIKNVEGVLNNYKSSNNLLNLSMSILEKNMRKAGLKNSSSFILEDRKNYHSNSSEKNLRVKNSSPKHFRLQDKDPSDEDSDSKRQDPVGNLKRNSELSQIEYYRDSYLLSSLNENQDKSNINNIVVFKPNDKYNNIERFNEKVQEKSKKIFEKNDEIFTKLTPEKVGNLYNFFEIINLTFLKKYYYYFFGIKKKHFEIKYFIEDSNSLKNESFKEDYSILNTPGNDKTISVSFYRRHVDFMICILDKVLNRFKVIYSKQAFQILKIREKQKGLSIEKEIVYVKTNILSKSPKTPNKQNPTIKKSIEQQFNSHQRNINNHLHCDYKMKENAIKFNDEVIKISQQKPFENEDKKSYLNQNLNGVQNTEDCKIINESTEKNIDILTLRSHIEVSGESQYLSNINQNKSDKLDTKNCDSQRKILEQINPASMIDYNDNIHCVQSQENALNDYSNYKISNDKNSLIRNDSQNESYKSNPIMNDGSQSSRISPFNEVRYDNNFLTLTVAKSENLNDRLNENTLPNINLSNKFCSLDPNGNEVSQDNAEFSKSTYSKVKFSKNNDTRSTIYENIKMNKKSNNIHDNEKTLKETTTITNHNLSINIISKQQNIQTVKDKVLKTLEISNSPIVNQNSNLKMKILEKQASNYLKENSNEEKIIKKKADLPEENEIHDICNSLMISQNDNEKIKASVSNQEISSSCYSKNIVINSKNDTFTNENLIKSKNKFSKSNNLNKEISPQNQIIDYILPSESLQNCTKNLQSSTGKERQNSQDKIKENIKSQDKLDIVVSKNLTYSENNFMEDENNFNFSEILYQNKLLTEENVELSTNHKEDLIKKSKNRIKNENKSKKYQFYLDLQNVLNKIPKEDEFNKIVVKTDNILSKNLESNDKKILVPNKNQRKMSDQSSKEKEINNRGNRNSSNDSRVNIVKINEQSEKEIKEGHNKVSLNENPLETIKKSDSKFDDDSGSFSKVSKPNIKDFQTQKSENILIDLTKDTRIENFIFDEFSDKNINLPLSTNFHHIIYTPRFKNRNNNQSQDTLNSENSLSPIPKNTSSNEVKNIFKSQKFEDQPIKLTSSSPSLNTDAITTENKIVIGTNQIAIEDPKIKQKEKSHSQSTTNNDNRIIIPLNFVKSNTVIIKKELTICREISIESRSIIPQKNIKIETSKNIENLNENDMTPEIIPIDFKKQTFQKNLEISRLPENGVIISNDSTTAKKEVSIKENDNIKKDISNKDKDNIPKSTKDILKDSKSNKKNSNKEISQRKDNINKETISNKKDIIYKESSSPTKKDSTHIKKEVISKDNNHNPKDALKKKEKMKDSSPNNKEIIKEKTHCKTESNRFPNEPNSSAAIKGNFLYLKRKSIDKFNNKSVLNTINNTKEVNNLNESQHNLYNFDSQIMTPSAILNLDPDNSTVNFKPNLNIDNFYLSSSTNPVDFLMSNRSSKLNKEGEVAKIEEKHENIEIKNGLSKKSSVNSNKNIHKLQKNKIFQEDNVNLEPPKSTKIKISGSIVELTEQNRDSSFENSNNNIPISLVTLESNKNKDTNKNNEENINTKLSSNEIKKHHIIRDSQKISNSLSTNDYNKININDLKKFTNELKPKTKCKNNTFNEIQEKNNINQNNYNKISDKEINENVCKLPNNIKANHQINKVFTTLAEKDFNKLNLSVNLSKINAKMYETPKVGDNPERKKNNKYNQKVKANENMLSVNTNHKNNPNLFNSNSKSNINTEKQKKVINFKSISQNQLNDYKNFFRILQSFYEKISKSNKKLVITKFYQKSVILSPSISRTHLEQNTILENKANSSIQNLSPSSNKISSQDISFFSKKKVYSTKIIIKVIKRRLIFFKLIFLNRVFQLVLKNQIHQLNVEQIFFSNDDIY